MSAFYFALTLIALLVAAWLIFQILGFAFKVLFFAAVLLVAVGAFRVWRATS